MIMQSELQSIRNYRSNCRMHVSDECWLLCKEDAFDSNTLHFCHMSTILALQVERCCINMEDSAEQSHWASPALLGSDPLAGFSTEPSLLPPGEDGEVFFSGQDADYASLPSFFSTPSHSRAPSTYRHSSGQCCPPPRLYPPSPPSAQSQSDLSLSCFLKSVRCSPRRVSSATCSSWMGPAATL